MNSRYRFVLRYGIASLLILLVLLLSTNWGLMLVFNLATGKLGDQLTVGSLNGSILGPISLQNLRYHDSDLEFSVEQADLDLHTWMLLFNKVSITSLDARGMHIKMLSTEQQGLPVAPLGSYQYIFKKAKIEQFEYYADPTSSAIKFDSIDLQGAFTPQHLKIDSMSASLHGLQLSVLGQLDFSPNYPMHFESSWKYQSASLPVVTGKGTIQGNLQRLTITQQLAEALEGDVHAQIDNLLTQPSWQGQMEIRHLAVKSWYRHAPNIDVNGTLHGQGDFTDIQIKGDMRGVHPKLGVLDSALDIKTQDTFDNYQFTVDNSWHVNNRPSASLQLEGTGTHAGVKLARIYGKTAEGAVRASGEIQWRPTLIASAKLSMRNLDTSLFWPQWPGLVGAQLNVATKLVKGKPDVQLQLTSLSGQLRGYSLSGSAETHWYNNQLTIPHCDLHIGTTQLTLSGALNQQWDLHAKLESNEVNAILPAASGALTVQGQLVGARNLPRIQAQWQGRELKYRDFTIQKMNGEADLNQAPNSPLMLHIQANDVAYKDVEWRNTNLALDGTTDNHRLSWQFEGNDASTHGALQGSYQSERWQGTLNTMDIMHSSVGRWVLPQPVNAIISSQQKMLQHFCLQHEKSNFCADIDWGVEKGAVSLSATAIPLGLIDMWLPDNLSIDGQFDMSAHVTRQENDQLSGRLTLQSAANSIVLELLDRDETIHFGAIQLNAAVDHTGLNTDLAVPLQDGGGATLQLRLNNWSIIQPLDRAQALQGKLHIEHIPMATLARFVPNLGRVEGHLESDMTFGGTLGQPQLSGKAGWEHGKAVLPALGITLQDVNAQVQSAQGNLILFQLSAHSGEGELRLQGQTQLDAAAGWPTEAKLTGNNAEALNISEAWVLLSPDLAVSINGNQIVIKGEVTIPRARLQPRSLPEGSVALSDDVVILAKDRQPEKTARWKLNAQVRVRFGDLVDFDGFGLSGKLTGNLLVIDEPGKFTVGQGEVGITDGIYRMRGQNLSVTRGRLLYAHNLLTEPGVDVEASRVIGDVTAGVRVRGTLQKPELKIFSTPAMSDSDALSYLVLGHPLNQASTTEGESVRNAATAVSILSGDLIAREIGGRLGLDELRVEAGQTAEQTSLVAGKYLSPKLYVRYFSGLVESSNIVQLRYQLSKRLQIQTEGGYRGAQSVTGGDLIFTLEY